VGDLIGRLKTEGPQIWQQLSWMQRGTLLGVMVAAVAAVIYLTAVSQQTEYSAVFTGLTESDAAAITAKLKELKIPYQITDGGGTVRVTSDKVYDVRMQLVAQGLPKGGSVGYELFDKMSFGLTDFAQKLNYQRALEGELARTIGRLSGVEESRVHIVLPQSELFMEKEKPTTASIVVKLKPGAGLDAKQVRGVVNLVARSVEGLKTDNVTVLDGDGNTLSGQDDLLAGGAARTASQSDAQRNYERAVQSDIQAMLEQVLGPRKAVVRVNAAMDWDQYESSSETYAPAGKPSQVRSSREIQEKSAVPLGDGSIITTPSYPFDTKTPAGPVSPTAGVATPGPAATPGVTAATSGDPKYERREATTNYEVSKLVEKTVKSPGAVKRLSVSVLLDGQLDDAATGNLTKAVTAAAGLDMSRGDTVVVSSMPFDQSVIESRQKETDEAAKRELYIGVAKGAMVVISLLVVLLLVRGAIKSLTKQPQSLALVPAEAEGMAGMGPIEELPAGEPFAAALAAPAFVNVLEDDSRAQQIQKEISDLAMSEPKLVAQIVKSWLEEK
jgi:flagellar M-ring protein FliF